MTSRVQYWGMLTPQEVRKFSIWALVGLAARIAAPFVRAHVPLAGILLEFFGSVTTILLLTWIMIGAPGWRTVKSGELDEREIAERQQAFAVSYVILGGCVVAAIGLSPHLIHKDWQPLRRYHDVSTFRFLVMWFIMALPGIVLAWRDRGDAASVDGMDSEIA